MDCQNKLVITLSVENDQAGDVESMETVIEAVDSDSGQQKLIYPVKITLEKTKVTARYPLRYRQDFNNRAKELVIFTSVFDCEDGARSNNPTCGWKKDSNGDRIWDSQGYCCSCDFSQIIGFDQTSYTRGQSCQLFNVGTGSASAHCLIWDDLWYSAYEIGAFQTYYVLTAHITKADINGNYTTESISVSPSNPITNNEDAIIRLVGDFYPNSPPPSLNSYFLFTPSRPLSNTRVQMGSRYWMFIRGEDITFDGTECNKIGASYTALRGQNNKCQMQPKSCFKNQLEDRYNEDIKRTSQGKSPLHFIEQYGNFSMILSSNVTYLQLGMQGRYSSLVTLEVNGDSLRYVTNLSDGKIDYAYLPNFEALSGDGELETQISNIGNVAAQYILGILCDDGVSPLGAQTVSLKAMESKILNFDIQVESTDSNEYFCNITLYNSIGSVVDSYPIYFNTTTRHTDTGTQGGNGGKQTGDNITDSSTSGCSDSCPQWYNVFCFFMNGCWGGIMIFISVFIGIILFSILLKFIVRRYGICCQKLLSTPKPK